MEVPLVRVITVTLFPLVTLATGLDVTVEVPLVKVTTVTLLALEEESEELASS